MDDRTIFLAALEQPDGEARAAYLTVACGDDRVLRGRIEELLALHGQAGDFLERSPFEPGRTRPLSVEIGWPSESASEPRTHVEEESEGPVVLDFLSPSTLAGCPGCIGPYEVIGAVGRGGMGIVLKARDTRLNRVVAVKVLAPELSGDALARKRFLREARAGAAVVHQHVVTIHAVDEDRLPYLVMEYVEGQSLQEKIDREAPLSLPEVLRIGAQVAVGLAAAHAHGLIHRDIKPANILLENGVERVRITDFGLARAVDDALVTQSGEMAGTPQYMSPEQAQGERVDARSDLFSLGCVLYAMCTGRSPFRAASTAAAIRRVIVDAPQPLRDVEPEVPDWLADIIERLLAKHPEDRYQSAAEVASLLGQYLAQVQDPDSAPRPARSQRCRAAASVRVRRWLAAAVLLMASLAALGVSDATGVTHIVPTLIRIASGEGTLVVEIADPGVSVQVDGEAVVVTGAGIHELRVTPGHHEVEALRDGKPVHSQLVSIARGGRKLVTITRDTQPIRPAEEPVGEVRRWEEHDFEAFCLAVSPDGRRSVVGDAWPVVDGTLAPDGSDFGWRLLDLQTGEVLLHVRGEPNPIRGMTFTPDGRQALSAGLEMRRWDLATGEELPTPRIGLPSGVRAAAFSSDARRVVIAGYDRNLRLWDLETGRHLATYSGHTDEVGCVALSPDHRRIVACCTGHHVGRRYVLPSGNTLRVWDVETGAELHRFDDFTRPIGAITISPDSRYVLGGVGDKDDLSARLWDLETGELLQVFQGHTDAVTGVCFSPDGRRILTGSADEPKRTGDGTIRLWDVETGAELHRFYAHRGGVRIVRFSPDGRYALSGGVCDGTVKLWRLPPVETASN